MLVQYLSQRGNHGHPALAFDNPEMTSDVEPHGSQDERALEWIAANAKEIGKLERGEMDEAGSIETKTPMEKSAKAGK